MTEAPTVDVCRVENDPDPVMCSPDEWLANAGRLQAAGVRRVVLDALSDGSPWNDEAAELDPASDTWAFAPWPCVAFVLHLDF